MSNYSPRQIKKLVDDAWYALQSACYRVEGSATIDRLLEESSKAERCHRRFMSGGPHSGYRVSVDTAAKLIAMQQVLSQLRSRKQPNVEACSSVRHDVVIAWGLAWRLKSQARRKPEWKAELRRARKALETIESIDYADDCAR